MEYKNFFLQARRMKIRTKWIPGTCKVGDDSLDLYLFKADGKYLLTDFGHFLRVYLSDGQTEEKSRESAQKAGFDLVDREIVKYIDDSEDIIESIIEVLNWCLAEKNKNS